VQFIAHAVLHKVPLPPTAGRACPELVEGMPARRAVETPATQRVAASKPQALGMDATQRLNQ
jgi:hypothetical protein